MLSLINHLLLKYCFNAVKDTFCIFSIQLHTRLQRHVGLFFELTF